MRVLLLLSLCLLIFHSCNNTETYTKPEVKQHNNEIKPTATIKAYTTLLQFDRLKGEVKSVILSTFHAKKKKNSFEKVMLGNEYKTSYDRNGNGIEKLYYNSAKKLQTKTEYEIDKNKKCIQAKVYNSSNIIIKIIKYNYDAASKIIEEISYPQGQKIIPIAIGTQKFKYNTKGLLTEETKFIGSNQFDIRSNYFYNNKGEIIETKYYRPENKMIIHGTTSYTEYDQKGNWIKCIEQTNKGSVFIVERQIEYY